MAKPYPTLSAAIKAEALILAKGPEFGHDRSQTVGASEIGRCIRQIAMSKQGVPEDKDYVDDPGFAARGNVMEDGWIAPLFHRVVHALGGHLMFAGQANQETFVVPEWHASVTPDGLSSGIPTGALKDLGIKKFNGNLLHEFKSISPRFTVSRLPKPEHVDQVNYGLGIIRAARVVARAPDYCLLTYTNADTYTTVHPFVRKFDEEKFWAQIQRAKKIVTTDWKKLPLEGELQGGKQCKYCSRKATCKAAATLGSRVPKAKTK